MRRRVDDMGAEMEAFVSAVMVIGGLYEKLEMNALELVGRAGLMVQKGG